MEMLSAGLPVKVLVQTDDLLEDASIGAGHFAFGMRSEQLASMAMGLNDVYVLQSGGSNLFQFRDRILGAGCPGPGAVQRLFGRRRRRAGLPPYLLAAAAMESRAFPAFSYDPAGRGRLGVALLPRGNTQVEADWPTETFAYEDEATSACASRAPSLSSTSSPATRARRATSPACRASAGTTTMVPAAESLALPEAEAAQRVPYVLPVDDEDRLQRVIVDAGWCGPRCAAAAGTACRSWAASTTRTPSGCWRAAEAWEARAPGHARRGAGAPAAAPLRPPPPAVGCVDSAPHPDADEPYIETPRCTTCNECTQINDRMFAYNENKQAYIKDLTPAPTASWSRRRRAARSRSSTPASRATRTSRAWPS